MVVKSLFLCSDDTIKIPVTNGKFMADVSLIAHMIVNNIAERQDNWQDCFEVLSCVTLGMALLTFCGRLGWAPQVVVKLMEDGLERWQVVPEVDWVVLHPVVLKKLHKTDFVVVVEIHQLILSDIFCSVSTALADIADQGLELSVSDLAILNARVEVGEVELS